MSENVSHRIEPETGSVTVEFDDLYEQDMGGEDGPCVSQTFYDAVEILESGWVRCIAPEHERDNDDGKTTISTFPPNRVNRILHFEDDAEGDA